MRLDFPFGEWLPDAPSIGVDGLEVCTGVVHQADGYAPYPLSVTQTYTGTITGTRIGAATMYQTDGTPLVVIGTTDDLYVILGGAATATGLGLSLSSRDTWQFERFGSSIYATNKSAGLFRLADVDTDTTFSLVTAPKARCIARIGDFLVLGDINDGGTLYPYRVQWSPFNNPTGTWGTDIATQAGYVDMLERYGAVTGFSSGETAIIFQERGASRIVPGGTGAFSKEVIEEGRGCYGPSAIAEYGSRTFVLGPDGVYAYSGGTPENVSAGKVWQTLIADADLATLDQADLVIDWSRRALIVGVKKSGETETTILSLSMDTGWWTKLADLTQSVLFEGFDTTTDKRVLGAAVSAGTFLFLFTEVAESITNVVLTTKRFQPSESRTFLNEFWIIANAAGLTSNVEIQAYNGSLDGTPSSKSGALSEGYFPFTLDGRQFDVTVSFLSFGLSADPKLYGFQLNAMDSGRF